MIDETSAHALADLMGASAAVEKSKVGPASSYLLTLMWMSFGALLG